MKSNPIPASENAAAHEHCEVSGASDTAGAKLPNSGGLAHCFSEGGCIRIKQEIEGLETAVGMETRNRYSIDFGGPGIGRAQEIWAGRMRVLFDHRPVAIEVYDVHSRLVLCLRRPTYVLLSQVHIKSGDGVSLGAIRRRWSWVFSRVYDLVDAEGSVFAFIRSPRWRIWTFPIFDSSARKRVGMIKKLWGGLLKEAFTDADTFTVDLGSTHGWSPEQRAIGFVAGLAIDLDLFEKR